MKLMDRVNGDEIGRDGKRKGGREKSQGRRCKGIEQEAGKERVWVRPSRMNKAN